MNPLNLSFLGFGNMAQAIAGGLDISQFNSVTASDPSATATRQEINLVQHNITACHDADIIVLAVKPKLIASVCQEITNHIKPSSLIISIAAGTPVNQLQDILPQNQAIVRCMPNTPALIKLGASGLFANNCVSDMHKAITEQLFSGIGIFHWLEEERLIDVITALSGSGPAYVFLLIEAMSTAANELGLNKEIANQFAIQTALGASNMASKCLEKTSTLRQQVTSPGGTTAAALDSLDKNHFTSVIKQAMIAAVERAELLAKN